MAISSHSLVDSLSRHLKQVREQHARDLAAAAVLLRCQMHSVESIRTRHVSDRGSGCFRQRERMAWLDERN